MNKIDFIKTEDIVKQILIDNERARNDDMYLYYVYCLHETKDLLSLEDLSFSKILASKEYRANLGIKPYHTISRCRRKIQAQCPELESERTKRLRAKKEEQFKDYARL